jgi:hypothetical protein
MHINKLRLFYSVNGSEDFHEWAKTWHNSMSTNTSDTITNNMPESPTTNPNVNNEWYQTTFTYNSNEDTEELQQLYDKISEYCKWSKVAYHLCPDVPENTDPHDCSIDESDIYRDGDIPEYIPSLN